MIYCRSRARSESKLVTPFSSHPTTYCCSGLTERRDHPAIRCRRRVVICPPRNDYPLITCVCLFLFSVHNNSSSSSRRRRRRLPPPPPPPRATVGAAPTRKGKTDTVAGPVPSSSRRCRTEAVAAVVPQTRNSPPAVGRTARTTRTRFTPPQRPKTKSDVWRVVACHCRRRQASKPRLWNTEDDGTECTPRPPLPRTTGTDTGTVCPRAWRRRRRIRRLRRPPQRSSWGQWLYTSYNYYKSMLRYMLS